MKKKKLIYIILAVVCVVVLLIAHLLSGKKLDMESEQVKELYSYLGEVDIYHCGGLNTYSDKTITKSEISPDNLLCMAYYNLTEKKKETVESKEKNKNGDKICKVGENITFAADDDESNCNYNVIKTSELSASYKDIYGEEIVEYKDFEITSDKKCFLEEDTYYCGTTETFTYSITPQSTVYRLMKKAVKELNGDIIIYDYFLKDSAGKCYSKNSYTEENEECTNALKDATIDKDFLKKYASTYKHTYKKDENGNYYWLKSEVK